MGNLEGMGRNGKDKNIKKSVGSGCSVHEHSAECSVHEHCVQCALCSVQCAVCSVHEHWHEKSRHAHRSWTSADSWNEIFESRNQRIKESLNQKATLQGIAGCESIASPEKIGLGEGFLNHSRPFGTDNVP